MAIVTRLTAAGHRVVAVDIDGETLEEVYSDSDQVVPCVGDVTEWSTHERAADLASQLAPLHHWVNNAGTNVYGGAHNVSEFDLRAGFDLIALGPLFGTAIAVRKMLRNGRGSIVTIASIQGTTAFPDMFVYGSAKAAIIHSARSVAIDYGGRGIRCNIVSPGIIDTPGLRAQMTSPNVDQQIVSMGDLSPAGRVGQPDDVASAVEYLLSDAASYINGTALIVDGGTTARCIPLPPVD